MVDMVLPFGLHSAPFIFTSIADLVEWILVHNYGMDFLRHYLDDFFFHLRMIHLGLDFSGRDQVMLWAACYLAFFSFLHAGEFMVNSAFQPSIHDY